MAIVAWCTCLLEEKCEDGFFLVAVICYQLHFTVEEKTGITLKERSKFMCRFDMKCLGYI